jgi:hypothetical protein
MKFPSPTYTVADAARITGLADSTITDIVARESLGSHESGRVRLTRDEVRRLPKLVRKRGRPRKQKE